MPLLNCPRSYKFGWRGLDPLMDLGCIFVGGMAGTLARSTLSDVVAAPWGLFAINTAGAFLLGLLLGWRSTLHEPRRHRRLTLTLGTGFLGAFTTYSALAVVAASSMEQLAWAAVSALVGVAAALAGITLGARR